MFINVSMLAGFFLLLTTILAIHFVLWSVAGKIDKLYPDKRQLRPYLTNHCLMFYSIIFIIFGITMLWVGITHRPVQHQGTLDTTIPGKLEFQNGENNPIDLTEKLNQEARDGQTQSMEDLEKFRTGILKENKTVPVSE